MRIDHVILASRDLDATAARLRAAHGLGSVPGGRHRGLGTANRIVPLGGGYLELLTVVDDGEAAASVFGAWAKSVLADAPEALLGWAVAVADVDAHARRLGTAVDTIERAGLVARNTGMAAAAADPCLPFFITRGAGVPNPGDAPADHDEMPHGFASIDVGGDELKLRAWLGEDDALRRLGVRMQDGPSKLHAVTIGTDGGLVVLSGSGSTAR